MQYLNQNENFLGLVDELAAFETAPTVVWPLPYEATTTYATGTNAGPAAILAASQQVEFWDEELDSEPSEKGICTLAQFNCAGLNHEKALNKLADEAERLFAEDKFVLSLGGEHSVTIPLVQQAAKYWQNLSVLQLDAHSDLRESYEGSPLNHACVMARVAETCPFVSVGLRSGIQSERRNLRPDSRLIYAWQMQRDQSWMDKTLAALAENVYITFDLDFFDPSIMPAVGTPEPGGFFWYETLALLRRVFAECNVIACDIVELKPIAGLQHPEFLAAKLAYKMIGYKFGL